MDTCSLPKARPISCKDCPAFQRRHMSIRWFAESFTRLLTVINTTFTDTEKMYSRWCCIDRLSWQGLSEGGIWELQARLPRRRLLGILPRPQTMPSASEGSVISGALPQAKR